MMQSILEMTYYYSYCYCYYCKVMVDGIVASDDSGKVPCNKEIAPSSDEVTALIICRAV